MPEVGLHCSRPAFCRCHSRPAPLCPVSGPASSPMQPEFEPAASCASLANSRKVAGLGRYVWQRLCARGEPQGPRTRGARQPAPGRAAFQQHHDPCSGPRLTELRHGRPPVWLGRLGVAPSSAPGGPSLAAAAPPAPAEALPDTLTQLPRLRHRHRHPKSQRSSRGSDRLSLLPFLPTAWRHALVCISKPSTQPRNSEAARENPLKCFHMIHWERGGG